MSLYLKVRAVGAVAAAVLVTIVVLCLPAATFSVTPSPVGASAAIGILVALAVPVAAGWGCSRADCGVETVAIRRVRLLDLAYVLGATLLAALAAAAAGAIAVAPQGMIAARAMISFLGILLIATPAGWSNATFAPAAYLIAVLILGRGEDVVHPAPWAWIASPIGDTASWIVAIVVLVIGALTYWAAGRCQGV